MSDDQNSYRPRSPDFSSFGDPDPHPHPHPHSHPHPIQPPPRLGRLPTYQIQEPSLPKGYSFSPRGSYDASPFFSPVTQQPHPSYFNFPPVTSPQATSAELPPLPLPPSLPTLQQQQQQQQQFQSQPIYQSQYTQSPPRLTHQSQSGTPYSKSTVAYVHQVPFSGTEHQQQLIDDMARLRQRKPVNYSENQPALAEYEEPAPLPPLGSQHMAQQAPYPQHNQPPAPLAEPFSTQFLFSAATKVPTKIDVRTKFPVARIKRIMQADEDVGKVAQATPSAVSKALELFMIALVSKGAAEAKTQNSKRITATHLKNSLLKDPQFDFLNEVCESAPDEGSKKRAKSETKDSDSEDEVDPKRKSKSRRKKTGSEIESD